MSALTHRHNDVNVVHTRRVYHDAVIIIRHDMHGWWRGVIDCCNRSCGSICEA